MGATSAKARENPAFFVIADNPAYFSCWFHFIQPNPHVLRHGSTILGTNKLLNFHFYGNMPNSY